jgi:hypothetical protein
MTGAATLAPMKGTRKPLPEKTALTYDQVVKNVQAYLDDDDTPKAMRKRFEAACLLGHSDFSHRMTKYRGELFRIEHFGAMAVEAKAPFPWPFVSWAEAETFLAFKKLAHSVK